jgi:phosphatidylglycerophosphate synthase
MGKIKNKYFSHIILYVFIFLFLYLLFSFIEMGLNPNNWNPISRILVVFISMVFILIKLLIDYLDGNK